jgi:mannose-6-phosphate isomerase
MVEYEVEPGDSFLLYANTMHYSKGGVLFYEIMQNSDITVGLNRVPEDDPEALEARVQEMADQIHLEAPFDCRTSHVAVDHGGNRQTYIFACRYFCLERWDLTESYTIAPDGERFYIYSVVEGHVTLRNGGHEEQLVSGDSFLVPAQMGNLEIVPDGQAALLKTYVPDLMANVIEPLRAQGASDEAIAGLGGVTRLNDLVPLL